jgi:hypothetical protein
MADRDKPERAAPPRADLIFLVSRARARVRLKKLSHERSAKRQGERGLILCPLSSNLPYRSRRVELRLQQRRKTEEAGFELSVPRDTTKVLKTPEVASA